MSKNALPVTVTIRGSVTLNHPRGLAFNRGGQLYVAEVGENPNGPSNGDILKFSPDGTRSTFVVVPGAINSGPEFLAFQLLSTPPPHPTPPPPPKGKKVSRKKFLKGHRRIAE